jgi:enoyl-CoA hydratase/carnithine racemase
MRPRSNRYTVAVQTLNWNSELDPPHQIAELCATAQELGFLVVAFRGGGEGAGLPWSDLEPWTRSRAVTVADIKGDLAPPALDVALCADLVYLRTGAALTVSSSEFAPTPGVIWALGRAGRAALERGLLNPAPLVDAEAADLGIAHEILAADVPLPLPSNPSIASLTAARDLMRASVSGPPGLGLELASFRLLFAAGEPTEGARAFLEKRKPVFES